MKKDGLTIVDFIIMLGILIIVYGNYEMIKGKDIEIKELKAKTTQLQTDLNLCATQKEYLLNGANIK